MRPPTFVILFRAWVVMLRKVSRLLYFIFPTQNLFKDGKVFATQLGHGEFKDEHEAAKWLSADRLDSVDWLPADVTIIPGIAVLLKASAL